MACFRKRQKGNGQVSFQARIRLSGFPQKTATFDKLSEAKDWARKEESDLKAGRYMNDLLATRYTMGQVIDRYIEEVLESKTSKPRYAANQRAQLLWWKETVGTSLISNCNQYVISAAVQKLSGKNYTIRKKGTINRYLACLSHVFNTAIKKWGWANINPIAIMEKPKEPRGRIRFLSQDELTVLLAGAVKVMSKPLYLVIMFALTTAARKGEIFNLKVKDLDLQRKVAVIYETKNHEPRQLYLTDSVCDLLEAWLLERNPRSAYVFSSRISTLPMSIEKEWRELLKVCKLNDFRFHDLRHTAASYYAMNGTDPATLAEILGHKQLKMVKRYAHLSTSHIANVVRKTGGNMYEKQTISEVSTA